jgi:MoaA/NifB/PqqE/SkfB family radical SAM enzyme
VKTIKNLELHVVHSCNLTCESCSHYSNQGHKGVVSLEEAEGWMAAWDRRLRPSIFSLLGGEPTIHPRLTEFVLLAHKHWPRSRLRLVTNGFFLHRHPDLPAVLKATGTYLYLSVHHDSPEYRERLRPIQELVKAWVRAHGIRLKYYQSYKRWTRRYKGFGAAMEPYDDGQPRKSWKKCPAKFCRQLFDGKIYKCSPLAYLKLQDAKYHLSEKWRPYLQYQPLGPDCTDAELDVFFDREEEPYCNMCPAKPERFRLPMPLPSLAKSGAEPPSPPAPANRYKAVALQVLNFLTRAE